MALHHYLPASFLARFSADIKTEPARDRILIVGDKKNNRWFKAPASKVGCVRNLYTLVDYFVHPDEIDKTWTEYEQKLPISLETLIRRNIDAETWARVLVPFVACMLVRGPDFKERFNLRFPPSYYQKPKNFLSNDNANRARLIELQRLLGFVATAKWFVISTSGKEKLITNDLGYSPFANPLSGDIGMAIPLDHNIILAITPSIEDHTILREEANKWIPIINYVELLDIPQPNYDGINDSLAQTANRFIFGSDEKTIQELLNKTTPSLLPPEPTELGFPGGKFAVAHEFTWHRLIGAIYKPPSDKEGWLFPLQTEYVTRGWYPEPVIPLNLIEFPPALKRIKNTIQTRFYDPEIYFIISLIKDLDESGQYDSAIKEATNALKTKLSPKLKARMLAIRGGLLADIGKNREATKDFEDAITLDSSNADLYCDFGYALLKANNAPKAYKILSKAIKLNPHHGIAYSNRCAVQWRIGRPKEAISDATKAINLLPDGAGKANAYLNRGNILKELGQEQQANEDLTQAKSLLKKYSRNNKVSIV